MRGAPEHVSALFDRTVLGQMIDGGRMNLCAVRDELERAALELALAKSDGEVGRGTASDPGGTVRAMIRRHKLG